MRAKTGRVASNGLRDREGKNPVSLVRLIAGIGIVPCCLQKED